MARNKNGSTLSAHYEQESQPMTNLQDLARLARAVIDSPPGWDRSFRSVHFQDAASPAVVLALVEIAEVLGKAEEHRCVDDYGDAYYLQEDMDLLREVLEKLRRGGAQ
jgi:hypothetical protein